MTREERAAQVKAERKAREKAQGRSSGRRTSSGTSSKTTVRKVRKNKTTGKISGRFEILNKMTRVQKLVALATAVFVAVYLLGYGVSYYKVKKEQKELLSQNAELKKHRKELEEELKVSDTKEYIMEQARKSLRLMNKDEKIFYFEEDKDKNE